MILVPIGPVGAGKSTWARGQRALHLDVDAWMVRLYGGDPRPPDVLPWYLERRERARQQAWSVARDAVDLGVDVVLELGLVRRAEREEWLGRMQGLEVDAVWIDAPRDVRRARVLARNDVAGAQVVPPAMFEMASDAWEEPDDEEVARWGIRALR